MAQLHPIQESNKQDQVSIWVSSQYQAAWNLVVPLLTQLQNYNDPNLNVGFFSAEGDLIHQMLDCIYLGPYARMDYWPQSQNLEGLYYSRDENGGLKRAVDIRNCSKTTTLPFSCGSPNRKALIRYFVNIILLAGQNGNSLLNQLIRDWISQLTQDWSNQYKYDVNVDPNTYLPAQLNSDTYKFLNTSNVLTQMDRLLETMWQDTMFSNNPWIMFLNETSPDEYLKYKWNISADVIDEGRFDASKPTAQYTMDEAMTPPLQNSDPSLWDNCHGAIKHVLFTMPINPADGTLRDQVPYFQGGGPDKIEAHILDLVQAAFDHSPLFQMYNPKHKPSLSSVCINSTSPPVAPQQGQYVVFDDLVLNSATILKGQLFKPITALGFHFGTLGQAHSYCFCGWKQVNGECFPDSQASADLQLSSYFLITENQTWLMQKYTPQWSCPMLDFSEHFGFLDRNAHEDWIQGSPNIHTSTDTLLRYGPGGIRAGSLDTTNAAEAGKYPISVSVAKI